MSKVKISVIGSGPGGYVAAIRAAQLDAEVVVVERDEIGGTCLNKGCIPTKALLSSAMTFNMIQRSEEYGIEVNGVTLNLKKIIERKRKIVRKLRSGIHYLFKAYNIKSIKGIATLSSPDKVEVKTNNDRMELKSDRIIIATGSKPITIPSLDYSHPSILNPSDAIEFEEIPQKLIILGGGVIGLEFACIYRPLGADVTVVEVKEQILPQEDKLLAGKLRDFLEEEGIDFIVEAEIEDVNYDANKVSIELNNSIKLAAEKLLVCVGRKPNVDKLGLEDIGIETKYDDGILVNERMETSSEGVFAIGDVTGEPFLAHKASAEGIVAAENAMGKDSMIDYSAIPNCIYTFPEVATVGLSEEGYSKIKKVRFPFAANGKAWTMGEPSGFIQLAVDEVSDRIVGAQIIGPYATELIHEITLAIKKEITAQEISSVIHAHPTLSEAIMEAARIVHGEAIHVKK